MKRENSRVKMLQTKLWLAFVLNVTGLKLQEFKKSLSTLIPPSLIDEWYTGKTIATRDDVVMVTSIYSDAETVYDLALFGLMQCGPITKTRALHVLSRYLVPGVQSLYELRFPAIGSFDYSELHPLDRSTWSYELDLAIRGDIHALTLCLTLALVSEHRRDFANQYAAYEGLCWTLPPVLALPWVWPHRDELVRCMFDSLSIEDASGGIFQWSPQFEGIHHYASRWRRKRSNDREWWRETIEFSYGSQYCAFVPPAIYA